MCITCTYFVGYMKLSLFSYLFLLSYNPVSLHFPSSSMQFRNLLLTPQMYVMRLKKVCKFICFDPFFAPDRIFQALVDCIT